MNSKKIVVNKYLATIFQVFTFRIGIESGRKWDYIFSSILCSINAVNVLMIYMSSHKGDQPRIVMNYDPLSLSILDTSKSSILGTWTLKKI